jgi:hypothetical protein
LFALNKTCSSLFAGDVQPAADDPSRSLAVALGEAGIAGTASLVGASRLRWTPTLPLSPGTYAVTAFNVDGIEGAYRVPMEVPYVFTFTVSSSATCSSSDPPR